MDTPHLEDKGIGSSTDNPPRLRNHPRSHEPPPQLITQQSTKHQDYKILSADLQDLQEISHTTKTTDLSDFQKDPFYQKTTIWGAHYLHVISLNYDNLKTVVRTYYSTIQITE